MVFLFYSDSIKKASIKIYTGSSIQFIKNYFFTSILTPFLSTFTDVPFSGNGGGGGGGGGAGTTIFSGGGGGVTTTSSFFLQETIIIMDTIPKRIIFFILICLIGFY